MEQIEINHLSENFGKISVLKDISLKYNKGMIYGLIGENGAGKTTLFKCMMGLYTYTGEIKKAPDIAIGYLPADNFFYTLVTGLEYLQFCIKAKDCKIDYEKIKTLNGLFNLPLNRYASDYSTGMKKKLALMALLLQENDVYILDEPFNGIDLKGCIQLKKIIKNLKNEGKTIIISSHLISSLHEICETIHYLNRHIIYKEFHEESIEEIEAEIINSL
jgi:ABC-2 type transport system ATP-binding protein